MTYLEIDSAIIAVTQKVCDECKARLDAIPKENTKSSYAVTDDKTISIYDIKGKLIGFTSIA